MKLIMSEASAEGHPDKIADQISDVVVDAFLEANPYSRVACETMVTTNKVIIAGEARGPQSVLDTLESRVRSRIKSLGFEQEGFHWNTLHWENYLHCAYDDIAVGVDSAGNKDEAAGSTSTVFGYATRETPEFMPTSQQYAQEILRSLSQARHSGGLPEIGPDGKCQVTVAYEGDRPVYATTIVLAVQHREDVYVDQVRALTMPYVQAVFPPGFVNERTEFFVNPTGNFVVGGPDGDCGSTGRRPREDSYGGSIPHGPSFSGKDPTRIDRSGAYACRYLAKNVVAAELADRCTVEMGYAIGISRPLVFYIDLHETGRVDHVKLEQFLPDLIRGATPRGIREHLRLSRPIYARTAVHGHFGRAPDQDGGFSWEATNLVPVLRHAFNSGSLGFPALRRSRSLTDQSSLARDGAMVFTIQCSAITVDLAKAYLEFFSRILRQQLPQVPIQTELHESEQFALRFVIHVPSEASVAAADALRKYIEVLQGSTTIDEAYSNPIIATQVRIQRGQAALLLQNKTEILTLEKTLLSDRLADLKERISELKSSHTSERLGLQDQVDRLQNQIIRLTNDLSQYTSRSPELISQALRIIGDVVSRPSELDELTRAITSLQASQTEPIVKLLGLLKSTIERDHELGVQDHKAVEEILVKINKIQPSLVKRLGEIGLSTTVGVAGNALWSAVQNTLR